MKTGDLERQFGVSRQTIYNWIEHFSQYFGDGAKGLRSKQRIFDSNDYIVLATIAELSREGMSYAAIAKQLQQGYRVDDPSAVTVGYTDGRMIPAAAVEQLVDAAEVRTYLAQVTADRDKLLEMLAEEKQAHQVSREKVQSLQDEIARLQRELGRAEGELAYRRELEKRHQQDSE
jgi:DNA-binding transcriptional MerR regulator